MVDTFSKAQAAVDFIRQKTEIVPGVGIILGSGLGGFASQVEGAVAIPYGEIPGFPQSTVAGHSGKLVSPEIAGGESLQAAARLWGGGLHGLLSGYNGTRFAASPPNRETIIR